LVSIHLRISNQPADRDAWEQIDQTGDNRYADEAIFQDAEHLNFTLQDESPARQAASTPTRCGWTGASSTSLTIELRDVDLRAISFRSI
jgi:hypothetical protein